MAVQPATVAPTNRMVGIAIRCVREDLGLTQAEVARRCGVSRSAIHQVEHGKRMNNLATLHAIAVALQLGGLSELFRLVEIVNDNEALLREIDAVLEME